MVYPSHYNKGFLGFQNPGANPYDVINYSIARVNERLKALQSAEPERKFAKLRPWLQHFDLGGIYDAVKIKAQI